jgi:hypothetical protein
MRGGRRHCRAATGPQFPNALNTGATLTAVTTTNISGGATSGTNWSWNGSVCTVTGDVDGLNVAGPIVITGAGATVSDCVAAPASSGITIGASGVTVTACTTPSVLFNVGGLSNILVEQCTIQSIGEPVEMNITSGAGVTGLTIQDCTIGGLDATAGRSPFGVDDNRGNTDPSLLIQRCSIFWCRAALSITAGTLRDNYIHDFGYVQGDHSDGLANGGTGGEALQILHNSILMNRDETSPLILGGAATLQNVTIQNNLLAGGDYCIYGGIQGTPHDDERTDTGCVISGGTTLTDSNLVATDAGATVTGTGIPPFTTIGTPSGSTATLSQACTNGTVDVLFHYSSDIVISGNRFSRMFFPAGGSFGVLTSFDTAVASNVFDAGNVYHDDGTPA